MGEMQSKVEKLQLEAIVTCNCIWKWNKVMVKQEDIKGEKK